MSGAVQFAVVRTGVDEFKIIAQSDSTILRSYERTFVGARASILQELLDLEIGPRLRPADRWETGRRLRGRRIGECNEPDA